MSHDANDPDLDFVPDAPGWPEPLTPVQIEAELNRLKNAVAANQIYLMRLRTAEMDAKIDYEKAHLAATMNPKCPTVGRGEGEVTVAERDDWIRFEEFDAYQAYQVAMKRVKNCREYMGALEQQCSLVQSMNKSVVASYYGGQESGRPGHSRGGSR